MKTMHESGRGGEGGVDVGILEWYGGVSLSRGKCLGISVLNHHAESRG